MKKYPRTLKNEREHANTEVCTLLPPLACNLGPPSPGVCLPFNPGVCLPFKPGVCLPFIVGGLGLGRSSSSSRITVFPLSRLSTTNLKMLWLRLLRSFQSVHAVLLLPSPLLKTSFTPLRLVTTSSLNGVNMTSAPPPPWICTGLAAANPGGANRSIMLSL